MRTGFPEAIVGCADFLADDVRPQLDRLTKYSGMRGLRMQLQWHENPQYRFAAGPDLARHPKLQKNVARLADYNWTFDLQVFEGQMKGAAELAEQRAQSHLHPPACRHAGRPCRTPDGRDGAKECSSLPPVQTYSKLSALGTFIHRNDPGHIAAVVKETIGIFGAERCLFGSNFPVEKLWTQYADLIAAYRAAIEPLGQAVARAALHDTAARVYRLV